jgi:hypothetical protein
MNWKQRYEEGGWGGGLRVTSIILLRKQCLSIF